MTQTLAIFLDAYRELNSRRLFWVSLIISALVVGVFAMLGIDEKSLTIFGFHTPFPVNTSWLSRSDFYKLAFSVFGVGLWLSWISTILALVSTAGIFPDLITGGSIDLFLSKPISRLRLFFTKYAAALLFVALQALVFSVASFIVIGLRADDWEWGLFLAVPLVVLFYTYLYSVCVFLGMVTRSTVASLLLTLVFWFLLYCVQATEASLLMFRIMNQQELASIDRTIERDKQTIERIEKYNPTTAATSQPSPQLRMARDEMKKNQERRVKSQKTVNNLITAHRVTMSVETVLPKTSGTIDLLQRRLTEEAGLPPPTEGDRNDGMVADVRRNPQLQRELEKEMRSRTPAWIIGTSLGFEAIVLGLAAWMFCRRDF